MRLIALGAAIAVALAASACSAPSSDPAPSQTVGQNSVVFTSSGGVYQAAQNTAIIQPYMAETGVDVIQDSPDDASKIKQMVDAKNVTWDVVNTSPYFPLGNCGTYAMKLDYSIIDTSGIDPSLVTPCSVPAIIYSFVLAYNVNKYGSNPPKSWADFFDTKNFPGVRAINSGAQGAGPEIALLADGVDPAHLYPLDWNRAFAKLDTLGSNLIFWDSGTQASQMMETQEADMIAVYNGRGYNAVKNGAPYKPVWAGNVYLYDSYMVPVGSPRVNQAMKLINYAVSPAATGRLQDAIPYGAVNSKAPPPTQTGAFLDWLPTSHLKEGVAQDQQWWAENQKIAQQKWLGWFAG